MGMILDFRDTTSVTPVKPLPQIREEMLTSTVALLQDTNFGSSPSRLEQDVATWGILYNAAAQVIEHALDGANCQKDWSQTAVAVAALYARAPASLAPRLYAYEINEAFRSHAKGYEFGEEIIDFLDARIADFSASQDVKHVDALTREF